MCALNNELPFSDIKFFTNENDESEEDNLLNNQELDEQTLIQLSKFGDQNDPSFYKAFQKIQ